MVTMTTMTTLMYPVLQDPQARCNVPLLHVYVQLGLSLLMFEVLLNVLLRNKKHASNFMVYLYPT
jgi:hypothetical protein